ncbi:MAG TPA: helix-turn-helix domain-containing protein [Nocardioides sp.]|uniref:helix-turn-helix domain-containing protein n=1 Tax=Nocardioides sp. TaxID=35761 RepID=UPI002ED7F514
MAETGWQAIGRIAKARRERLGLNQDELAQYGGPKVATVGKFERAAQESFPLRTQHQIEKALGWSRGTIEQVVGSINEGTLTAADWEHDLVVEDVPDMSRPIVPPAEDGSSSDAVEVFASVFRLIPDERQDEALRAALMAIFPHLDTAGATHLGRGLRSAFPPRGGDGYADADAGGSAPNRADLELIAHDEEHAIEDEQGHDETP